MDQWMIALSGALVGVVASLAGVMLTHRSGQQAAIRQSRAELVRRTESFYIGLLDWEMLFATRPSTVMPPRRPRFADEPGVNLAHLDSDVLLGEMNRFLRSRMIGSRKDQWSRDEAIALQQAVSVAAQQRIERLLAGKDRPQLDGLRAERQFHHERIEEIKADERRPM